MTEQQQGTNQTLVTCSFHLNNELLLQVRTLQPTTLVRCQISVAALIGGLSQVHCSNPQFKGMEISTKVPQP